MRLSRLMQAARQRARADGAVAAYAQWRADCAAVRIAYRRWVGASRAEKPVAFYDYSTALRREEHAASRYAQLVRRAGRVPERGLARQLAEVQLSSRAH